jgi:hypothetical protein
MVLTEQIKILIELQKIDSDTFRLRQELGGHPALLKAAEQAFDKKKTGLKAAEEDLKAAQLKQKEKELELGSKEEKVKKLQGQLYTLKSNKEYQAMELEIKGLKADDSLLEEDIIRQIDVVEEAKKAVAKEKGLLAEEEKKFKEETGIIQKRAAEINAAIAVNEEKRKSFTSSVDPKILSQYERILKGRDGLALVPVKNNSCGGCHLGLPPQVVNEIQIQDKLTICESCARMLYWPG